MRIRMILIFATAALLLAACSPEMFPREMTEPAEPSAPTREPAMPDQTPTPNPNQSDSSTPDSRPTENAPYRPAPADEKLMRGPLFLDGAHLLLMESFPPQVMLSLEGSLPTPCHQLRAAVVEPDKDNRIVVNVYSMTDPNMMCTQVIKPFETGVNLGSYPKGTYTVIVNGEEIGTFDMP